jgi:L-cysteine S-thiosulfotransferase
LRCPELARLAAACLAVACSAASAAPADVKNAIAARLKAALPQVEAADYALGSAALDADLRAQVEANSTQAAAVVEAGAKLWNRKFHDGRTLAACFPNGGRRIAGAYPQYHPRLKRVVTLELAINQCLKAHHEPLYEPADPATMGALTAYLRKLSDGRRVAVRVPRAAEASFAQGQRLYFSRLGQRNFACASCHIQAAGKHYGERALSPAIGQATHWPEIRNGVPVLLQDRIRECLERMGAAPFAAGSDELNDIEYFLTYLSNGLALKANAWRPD